ncbi:THI20 [Sanghuangporus weigelae]
MSRSRGSSRTRSLNADHPVVMTIAGSDSSGGAGIQADLKTFTALQCFGTSVITALTAQNTTGVDSVFPIPPEFIEKQLSMILADMDVSAFKTGMLYDAANARAVAKGLRDFYNSHEVILPPLVIDPVCVSTSGHTLLEPDAVSVLIQELFPLAKLITPNKAEAELLLAQASAKEQKEIRSIDDALDVASSLGSLGSCDVLLKGGHLSVSARDMLSFIAVQRANTRLRIEWDGVEENMEILQIKKLGVDAPLVIDVLYERASGSTTIFARRRIDSTSTHGTGCTLSAAIASYLARGYSIRDAVRLASDYTYAGIKAAFPLGKGHGPLNHMHSFTPRVLPLPSKEDPYPFTRALIRSNADVWKQYVEHPFVRQLGEGTLPRESFLHFVKQDYQYLKYYARAYGLLVAKSRRFADIKPATDTILNVLNEVTMHKSYCSAELGISEVELEMTPESSATTAYGAFILDSGLRGDETDLIITLAACLLGYGEVGLWLKSQAELPDSWVRWEGNPYLRWIEDYSGVHYQNAVRSGLDILEHAAQEDPPSPRRFEQWKEVWGKCTTLEKKFWDMAMELS